MFVAFRSLTCAALVTLSACAFAGGGESELDQELAGSCNRHPSLCERSVADVAFPTTHNSYSTSASFTTGFTNQNRDISRQLADGIRGLMLDTYWHKPLFKSARAVMCHQNCTLGGYVDLVPELAKIRTFLASKPNEVILLFIEQHSLTPTQFSSAMSSAGLLGEVYTHPSPNAPWPTLGELISARRRVIVFFETDGTEGTRPAWYHRMHDEMFQNPYSYKTTSQFACNRDRGNANAQLYLVNHFLSDPAGWERLAKQANPYSVVLDHVSDCESQVAFPNAVAVDFYEQDGSPSDNVHSVVKVTDLLNGF
jgi:hypothetical protein